jgi:hypothetical protein
MDELVKLVAQKTGISQEIAKVAVDTVVGFLKQKLPAPIAGQIDAVLGSAGQGTDLGGLAKGLGGMLGKK